MHIEASTGQVIRTANDRTYLRIGDKSKEMLGENLRNLEYAKGSRHYEDEINSYATLEDLDDDLLNSYKEKIGAESIETSQVLRARGFLRQQGDKEYLTNAAVLLFAKNIMQFYSNCRVRFLRIDGRELQVGDKFNIIKDKSIDLPILRIIDEAKNYISDQLRVFITQDKFMGVLETANLTEIEFSEYCREKGVYPEQVKEWKEACINANDNAREKSTKAGKELRAERKEKEKLEKELARKEKALAEAAALLVLRKKADAIWGTDEEDE